MITPWLPLGIRLMAEEGIPKDTLLCNVPHSSYWLEFKRWTNGNFRVCLCEPQRDRKRIIHQSLTLKDVKKLTDFALLPHKRILLSEDFTKEAKALIKSKSGLRSTQRSSSRKPRERENAILSSKL